MKIEHAQNSACIADLITVSVKVNDFAQSATSAIADAISLLVIVIRFTKEAPKRLNN